MVQEIPTALKSLISTCESVADDLLDLLLHVRKGRQPGACVRTYFRLVDELPHHRSELEEIRSWLERVICVQANDGARELDRLPLELAAGNGLEDYCQNRMRDVFRNGRYDVEEQLCLEFRYAEVA